MIGYYFVVSNNSGESFGFQGQEKTAAAAPGLISICASTTQTWAAGLRPTPMGNMPALTWPWLTTR